MHVVRVFAVTALFAAGDSAKVECSGWAGAINCNRGLAAAVVVLAILAAISNFTGFTIRDFTRRRRSGGDGGTGELTDEVRKALLKRVRGRSSGQLQGLVESTGYLDLRLDPAIGLVRRPLDPPPVEAQPDEAHHAGSIEDAYLAAGGTAADHR